MGAVSVTVASTGAAAVVALRGDLAAAAVVQIEPYLAPLLSQRHPILVVDLAQVPSCDETGLLLLDVTARVATGGAGELRLAAPQPGVCRALRQAGIMRMIATFSSVTGALHGDALDLLATPHSPTRAARTSPD
jgi:anti-anti-sigma factor